MLRLPVAELFPVCTSFLAISPITSRLHAVDLQAYPANLSNDSSDAVSIWKLELSVAEFRSYESDCGRRHHGIAISSKPGRKIQGEKSPTRTRVYDIRRTEI